MRERERENVRERVGGEAAFGRKGRYRKCNVVNILVIYAVNVDKLIRGDLYIYILTGKR
jgi:hypothetical protein